MLASFQKHAICLLEIVTLNLQVIIIMHAASVALLLHGVLLASLAWLIIRANFSAQTLLLIGLLLNIHPKLLSYAQILPSSIQEPSQSAEGVPAMHAFRRNEASIRKEVTPKSEDRRDNDGRQSSPITGPVEEPRRGGSSVADEADPKAMEAESPTKSYLTRCKDRKCRDRKTFGDDKENEPLPVRQIAAKSSTTPISRRNGLRPLTLTNLPSLDVENGFGSRRTVSLFNGTKRLSPLFYVSDGSREYSPPAQISARRVSFPPDCMSRIESDVPTRIQGEMQLTSKLQEEMKLSARLRNDLVELRDRACAELSQSKHEAQALAVAVDARESFIKELAVSVELLRVENKVLKNAKRRDGEVILPEALTGRNIDKDRQYLSPKLKARETGQENDGVANIISQPSQGFRSIQGKKPGQRCVKRSSLTFGCFSGMREYVERNDFPPHTARWLSLGSVSEPTLEPPRSNIASNHASPHSFISSGAENSEYAVDTELTSEGIEVEFPTISPEFPPCHAAALARRKVASPPPDTVIYEVDRRALAGTRAPPRLPQDSADPATLRRSAQLAPIRHSPRLSVNDNSNATCLTPSCLAIQQDSPFYAVPAAAFFLPRAASPSSARCA